MRVDTNQEFRSLAELASAFGTWGCEEFIVKVLAPNQDNEKNQIYLGRGRSLTQYFPGVPTIRGFSESRDKAHSDYGEPILGLNLNFLWIWPDSIVSPAPFAKLIEYSQYPEVRLSGFLSRSPVAPVAVRRDEQDRFGQRVLVLGIANNRVFATVVTELVSNPLVSALRDLEAWPLQPILRRMVVPHNLRPASEKAPSRIDPDLLIDEIRGLRGLTHQPQALRRIGELTRVIPGGGQAGGWTLEALLGIPRNSAAEPDKYGFEIKAVGAAKTSLITTEPDSGYRFDAGVSAYLAKFGRPARVGEGKRVFSGVHKCNVMNEMTGAMLTIENWDFEGNRPRPGRDDPKLVLIKCDSNEIISGWSFQKIGASWTKKHAGAIYVETRAARSSDGDVAGYEFGPRLYLGVGTSVLHFFRQISAGVVKLDPGDSQALGAPSHARTQWRVEGDIKTLLPSRLEPLYDDFTRIDI